jgi:glycosyltransferase involved in cell wall biosynthesis
MADKIVLLLADRALREHLGAAGKKTAQQEFSVVEMVKKIEALYEELLGNKNVLV